MDGVQRSCPNLPPTIYTLMVESERARAKLQLRNVHLCKKSLCPQRSLWHPHVFCMSWQRFWSCLTTAATAQEIPTGQGGVCCAYILDSGNNWQLVCNNPGRVSWSVTNQLWHVMQ